LATRECFEENISQVKSSARQIMLHLTRCAASFLSHSLVPADNGDGGFRGAGAGAPEKLEVSFMYNSEAKRRGHLLN
jgi:hypothetical protein